MNTVLDFLERSAAVYPDREAYEDEKKLLTFAQTRDLARAVGTALQEKIRSDKKPVVVYLDKSVECIVSFFGAVYSGNFYCPLDTEMPLERVKIIMQVLQPAAVITDLAHRNTAREFSGDAELLLYEELILTRPSETILAGIQNGITELDPLYVLFTSGSTGVPKGVLLNHRVVVNYMEWLSKTFDLSCEDVFGNQAPFYFDVSIHDIYGAAYFGAKAVIIPRYMFGFPARLIGYLNEKKISTFLWVPSAMGIIARLKAFRAVKPEYLRHAMFAGEVFPRKQLDYWKENLPDVIYANLYGPTETYVCTAYVMTGEEEEGVPLPIGKPVSSTQALILDEEGRPVPEGEIGELCIRGSCLALGYYNNPERTASSFVQNPLHSLYPDRIYHTGDLVRLDGNGDLIYISRKDFQIKHMGYRIELGEIENAVRNVPGIEDCACTYRTERQRIVLYYEGKEYPQNELLEAIGKRLPEYMIPGQIVYMESLPRNLNGKIDRAGLAGK